MALSDGRVVSNLIVQALRGKPLTIYGDGSQSRSFCYVDDMIDGLIKLMEGNYADSPVNLGNPKESTIGELAKLIHNISQSQSQVEYHPLPEDDPKQRCPDISLAKLALGWEPRLSLADGLEKTLEYFRSRMAVQRE